MVQPSTCTFHIAAVAVNWPYVLPSSQLTVSYPTWARKNHCLKYFKESEEELILFSWEELKYLILRNWQLLWCPTTKKKPVSSGGEGKKPKKPNNVPSLLFKDSIYGLSWSYSCYLVNVNCINTFSFISFFFKLQISTLFTIKPTSYYL